MKVKEVEESFFDISLPMPEENTFKKVCTYYVVICIINMTL